MKTKDKIIEKNFYYLLHYFSKKFEKIIVITSSRDNKKQFPKKTKKAFLKKLFTYLILINATTLKKKYLTKFLLVKNLIYQKIHLFFAVLIKLKRLLLMFLMYG